MSSWPQEMEEAHVKKLAQLKPEALTQYGDFKTEDCVPIAEAILQSQLQTAMNLEGKPLYFNPQAAMQAEKGNLDKDTSKAKLPTKSFVKLRKIQALVINFPKDALSHSELKRAIEFSTTQLVQKINQEYTKAQQQAGVPLLLIRSPAEVEFGENKQEPSKLLIHVFCKIGLNYVNSGDAK